MDFFSRQDYKTCECGWYWILIKKKFDSIRFCAVSCRVWIEKKKTYVCVCVTIETLDGVTKAYPHSNGNFCYCWKYFLFNFQDFFFLSKIQVFFCLIFIFYFINLSNQKYWNIFHMNHSTTFSFHQNISPNINVWPFINWILQDFCRNSIVYLIIYNQWQQIKKAFSISLSLLIKTDWI